MTTEQNYKKKKLTEDIEMITFDNLQFDKSSDNEVLNNEEYNWDKINKLKDELGENIIEFIVQVNDIINNDSVLNKLGDKKDYFEKIIDVFFTDINNFSKKIKDVRQKHDGLTGPVEKIEDLDLFNNIVIQYQYLFSELATLITPTLSEIMVVISELGLVPSDIKETKSEEVEDEPVSEEIESKEIKEEVEDEPVSEEIESKEIKEEVEDEPVSEEEK